MEFKECWACGIPAKCEKHHLTPRQAGGADRDDNVIYLCEPCHSFIDRRKFRDTLDISWFLIEATKDPGPRWARLMLLEMNKLASHIRQSPAT
jgi:hypothetical protein